MFVWLGTSDSDIDKVMAHFAVIDRARRSNRENNIKSIPEDEKERIPLLPGFEKLFQKPWFTRTWVVQELLVAQSPPRVGCRDSWDNFESAMLTLGLDRVFSNQRYVKSTQEVLLMEFSISYRYRNVGCDGHQSNTV